MLGSYQVRPGYVSVGTSLFEILDPPLQSYLVQNIRINDITFAHSATTFLSDYEVPSGGDWTVHREAALVVEGVEGINISNCLLLHLDVMDCYITNMYEVH